MAYIVYIAINKLNGKRYIGVTCRRLVVRKCAHQTSAKNGSNARIHAAIRKYGRDGFEWSILEECTSKVIAYRREIEFIRDLKPEYNVLLGGDETPSVAWNKQAVMCLEDGRIFESCTAAARACGACVSEITKCIHVGGTAKGRHFAKYTQELSEAERMGAIATADRTAALYRKTSTKTQSIINFGMDRLGRSAAGPMRRQRAVICLTDGKQFQSVSAAAAFYSVQRSALIELCRKQRGRQAVGGLRFAYQEGA